MDSSSKAKFSVILHCEGFFASKPFRYDLNKVKTIQNVDFSGMKFVDIVELFCRETNCFFKAMYFCPDGFDLKNGLMKIKCHDDMNLLIQCGEVHGKVCVYLDEHEDDINDLMKDDEADMLEGVDIEFSDTDNDLMLDDVDETASLEHLSEGEDELNEARQNKGSVLICKKLDSTEHTMFDDHESFLKSLCDKSERVQTWEPSGQVSDKDLNFPRHNPNTHWKKMKPMLGELYESREELKECLTSYAVANGYKLWYERNDHSKLLVRCGKVAKGDPECPFRLWATWTTKNDYFQIKTLVDEHTCVRNFQCCSLVGYKWIGSKLGSRIRENPKMKLIDLQRAVLRKYKFHATISQCQRAKTWAIKEYEEGIMQHCEKLWSYAEEIRRTNPDRQFH